MCGPRLVLHGMDGCRAAHIGGYCCLPRSWGKVPLVLRGLQNCAQGCRVSTHALLPGLGFICTKNCQNMYIYVIMFGKIWTIKLKTVNMYIYM